MPSTPPAKISSRDAPKFIVRFQDEAMRDRIAELASRHYISMNSYILQAIAEKQARDMQPEPLTTTSPQ